RLVHEAVHVLVIDRVEQHPVVAGELAEATLERLGMHLGPVARGRSWEVDGVDLPGPGAGRIEAKLAGSLDRAHWSPFLVGPWRGRSGTVARELVKRARPVPARPAPPAFLPELSRSAQSSAGW